MPFFDFFYDAEPYISVKIVAIWAEMLFQKN